MNDEAMRRAYQALLRSREAGDRSDCPTAEELQALVQRTGDETTRLTRLDHVMRCPDCRAEFELLRAASAGMPPVSRVAWRPIALAAAVVLAVGLGFLLRRTPSAAPIERGLTGSPRLESPVGRVRAADATRLVWHPVPSALGYDVEVTTPQGDVRLGTSTTDTVQALPPLSAGEELRWWVRARLPDGEQRSEVARLIVLP